MDHIIKLHNELRDYTYEHGGYKLSKIFEPKERDIHKAGVKDRLLCHAIHRKLYPFFDKTFIADSYSCRLGKGTHCAINRFAIYARQVSKNNMRTCWVLKCDVKKFFASIDHQILYNILAQYISDESVAWLLVKLISSFSSTRIGVGLPLGNLTSQLLVNIYMNEFDQFMKHKLKVRHYIRYADDFVILSIDRSWLEDLIPQISDFLENQLELNLHPNKVSIETVTSGVDFLGWVHFKDHRVLRTSTKRRMFRNVVEKQFNPASLRSYLGLLRHGNGFNLSQRITCDIDRGAKIAAREYAM